MTAESSLTKAPREKAGPGSSRAFEFQKHFAMAKVLEAHGMGLDYTAWFDHHDDLVFVESPTSPLSFYQVKSDSRSWTPTRLSTRGKTGDNPRSVIGKAYYNIHVFGSGLARAAIVSNQMLKATHDGGEKTTLDDGEIVLGLLVESEWKVLHGALKNDFTGVIDSSAKTLLTFERVPLDLHSFQDTLKGQVASLAQSLGGNAAGAALPFYTSLLSEITRCTGDTLKAKSLAELKARKALTRDQVSALIAKAQARPETPLEWWPIVAPDLQNAGFTVLNQQRLRMRCLEYWRARSAGVREALALGQAVRTMIAAHPGLAVGSVMDCVESYRSTGEAPLLVNQPYDDVSAILVELMENPPDV